MLRYRQSSDGAGIRPLPVGPISAPTSWNAGLGKLTVSRTPDHGRGGFGALNRSLPSGGVAYGTPRNLTMPSSRRPRTLPYRVAASSFVPAPRAWAGNGMLIAAATDSDPPISALRVILELNIR